MEYNIAVVKGDGIGPEIVSEAMLVLDKVGEKFGHKFGFQEVLAGGCSIDKNGIPLTDETIEICKNADSVLLGAVGGPKWDDVPSARRCSVCAPHWACSSTCARRRCTRHLRMRARSSLRLLVTASTFSFAVS